MPTTNLGLSLTTQAAGSAVTFLDWRMLQDGNVSSNMLKIDAAYGVLSGSIVNMTSSVSASLVTGGNSHDHSGGDGGQIAHGSLSGSGVNTHTQIDSFIASKGSVTGIASLDGSTLVVQNPANATATRTASKIPISPATGFLDKWVTQKVRGSIVNPADIYASASRIVLMKADAPIYVTKVHISTNTTGATFNGTLAYATDTQTFANLTNVVTCNTTGTFTTTSTAGSPVSSGSYVVLQMDSIPSSSITQLYFEMYYMYAA